MLEILSSGQRKVEVAQELSLSFSGLRYAPGTEGRDCPAVSGPWRHGMSAPGVKLGKVVATVYQHPEQVLTAWSTSPAVAVGMFDPELSIGVVATSERPIEAALKVVLVDVDLGRAIVLDREGGPVAVVKVLSLGLCPKESVEVAA